MPRWQHQPVAALGLAEMEGPACAGMGYQRSEDGKSSAPPASFQQFVVFKHCPVVSQHLCKEPGGKAIGAFVEKKKRVINNTSLICVILK